MKTAVKFLYLFLFLFDVSCSDSLNPVMGADDFSSASNTDVSDDEDINMIFVW